MTLEQNQYKLMILVPLQSYQLIGNCQPFSAVSWMMNVFISLQRLLVCRTKLLGTVSNTSLEVIQPIPALNPTQLLSLNCFVLGDDVENVFTVEVDKTKNVSILKKLIKEEKSPIFNHIPANSLVLWKSSIPFNRNLKEDVETLDLDN